MKVVKESLAKAHLVQTEMIQREIHGEEVPLSMILIHTQDHLMNAMTVRDLAIEMIEIAKSQTAE